METRQYEGLCIDGPKAGRFMASPVDYFDASQEPPGGGPPLKCQVKLPQGLFALEPQFNPRVFTRVRYRYCEIREADGPNSYKSMGFWVPEHLGPTPYDRLVYALTAMRAAYIAVYRHIEKG